MNGLLLIDKPEGLSSAAVVRQVKKALTVEKIGHLGTLDPFASGLLPLCLGSGTKIAQFLMAERKSYAGTIRLGVDTDTLDVTGAVLRTSPIPDYDEHTLRALERRFSGEYWQTPPMYSALKRNGVPLYKLARRGVVVEREPRKIQIEQLVLSRVAADVWEFSLTSSKGAYMRVFAADIGAALGCGGHLASLRRTAFGEFSLHDALPLQSVLESRTAEASLLSPAQAMRHYPILRVAPDMIAQLRRGQQAVLRALPNETNAVTVAALIDTDGELVAVVERQHGQAEQAGQWRLLRVL